MEPPTCNRGKSEIVRTVGNLQKSCDQISVQEEYHDSGHILIWSTPKSTRVTRLLTMCKGQNT